MSFTAKKGCKSFYEANVSYFNAERSLFHSLSPQARSFSSLDEIETITIDYTLSGSLRNLIKKTDKGYQGKHKYLIIVSLTAKEGITFKDKNIPNSENVVIITPLEFFTLLGVRGKTLDDYMSVCELLRRALYSDKAREEVSVLAENYKEKLLIDFDYSTTELIEHLKGKKHILQ